MHPCNHKPTTDVAQLTAVYMLSCPPLLLQGALQAVCAMYSDRALLINIM